jgi:hypothetical protein
LYIGVGVLVKKLMDEPHEEGDTVSGVPLKGC